MSDHTPDSWVVLKITTETDVVYKVLAGWSSSYLTGTHWRLNSGITLAFVRENQVDFYGNSGSVYHCRKGSYGLKMGTAGIYNDIVSNFGDAVEMMPEDTDWRTLV
tara:strand:- start:7 stop:324 length:318 start_codon:yes stop_codon:yes gene_type:complete